MRTILTNYTEAINSEDSKYWVSTLRKEFNSLEEKDTFEWQKALKDKNIVGSRWVYTLKYKRDGSYKPDLWPSATCKYMVKITEKLLPWRQILHSVRLLLQVAVQYDLLIHPMDVKSAYLNAPLKCIYVDPPEGFKGKNGNYVWELKKSLYGLKQSGWS